MVVYWAAWTADSKAGSSAEMKAVHWVVLTGHSLAVHWVESRVGLTAGHSVDYSAGYSADCLVVP